MQPIVDGLKAEFGDRVSFRDVNARDGGSGETAFQLLALPGHPAFLIFSAGGAEIFRRFGIVEVETLSLALEEALESEK